MGTSRLFGSVIALALAVVVCAPVAAFASEGTLEQAQNDVRMLTQAIEVAEDGGAIASDAVAPENADEGIEALAVSYYDCDPYAWYMPYVEYVTNHNIMKGHDGFFRPDETITRGEVVTVLHRMAGSPNVKATKFSDVDYRQFYGNAIDWARTTGVVTGYGNNTFGPNEQITREQLAVMLSNYASKIAYKNIATDCMKLDSMPDVYKVNTWGRNALGWATDTSIINGKLMYDVRHIEPGSFATRAEVSKMVTVLQRDVIEAATSGDAQYKLKAEAMLNSFKTVLTDKGLDQKGMSVQYSPYSDTYFFSNVVQGITYNQARLAYHYDTASNKAIVDLAKTVNEASGVYYQACQKQGLKSSVAHTVYTSDWGRVHMAVNGYAEQPYTYWMNI